MEYKSIKHKIYKYATVHPYSHRLGFDCGKNTKTPFYELNGCMLHISRGYCWDGKSGPSIDNGNRVAGLVHDCLYQAIRDGSLSVDFKDASDRELQKLMKEEDTTSFGTFRAWYHYQGVRFFGASSCVPGSQSKNKMLHD